MIELCRKKGLPAMVGDMEKIPFQNNSFHGVWAYTSLLHMPKTKLSPVLERIDRILTPQGMFYIGMKEGDFEGWISNERYRGDKRFFSLYSHEELIKTLSKKFDIVHHSKITLGKKVYLNYLCKKNGFGV
jgi:ubiquinone/menaquinone biosynthesis C-methylase UbiE